MSQLILEPQKNAKKAAAKEAVNFIEEGMLVGLGTGSTAALFINYLVPRCQEGLKIHAVATSQKSLELAKAGGIPLADLDLLHSIDVTVDGADEIDADKQIIKGGGGALLREKIIASMSRKLIIIIDESKIVPRLGQVPLPVEIVPFAYRATVDQIEKMGYSGKLRKKEDDSLFITDNNNYLIDLSTESWRERREDLEKLQQRLLSIPGVVETGLFLNFKPQVIVGYYNGSTKIL